MKKTLFILLLVSFSWVSKAVNIYTEGFNELPVGWSVVDVNGTSGEVTFNIVSQAPSGYAPTEGAGMARFNSYYANSGNSVRLGQTTSFSTQGYENVKVTFDWLRDNYYPSNNDRVYVQWSVDGSTWNDAGNVLRYSPTNGWTTQSISLPEAASNWANLYVAFLFVSAYGNNCHLDNLIIAADPIPAKDLGIINWLTPLSISDTSSSDVVEIEVKNGGTTDVAGFDLSYSIDGGATFFTENITETLTSWNSKVYSFTAKADMSVFKTYNCIAAVHLASDEKTTNDTIVRNISKVRPDLALLNFISPVNNTDTNSMGIIKVEVKNVGTIAASDINISYSLNGGETYTSENIPGPLAPGDSVLYTFTTKAGMDIYKTYNCIAVVRVSKDNNYENDTLKKTIAKIPPDLKLNQWILPVSNTDTNSIGIVKVEVSNVGTIDVSDFNISYSIDGGVTYTTQNIPDILLSGTAAIYTFAGRAKLNLYKTYNCIAVVQYLRDHNTANDTLIKDITKTPPDLAVTDWVAPVDGSDTLTGKAVKIRVANLSASDVSNFKLSYSIDSGATFTTENIPGTISAGASEVYEFSATADMSFYQPYNCMAVVEYKGDKNSANDTLAIVITKTPPDLSVIGWVAPSNFSDTSSVNTVSIRVRNLRPADVSNFYISYSVDGGTNFNTENVPGILPAGASVDYTFAVKAVMNSYKSYNCIAVVKYVGDINTANDTLKTILTKRKSSCGAGASSDAFEYISRVKIGSIDNSTGHTSGGYANYLAKSTEIIQGRSANITVTNGYPYSSSAQCGIWVDWNSNGNFSDDAGISVSGTPGKGPYTATITGPAGETPGEKRMRVRVTYSGAFSACGSTSYGETEDYTIKLIAPFIHISPADQYIATASGSTGIAVTSNIEWTAVSDQAWCTVTPSGTGNSTITATCSANASIGPRTATVTVSGTGADDQIATITQLGTAPALLISPTVLNVAAISGSNDIAVGSNIAWTAVSNQPWCTVTPSGTGNDTITATYTKNTNTSSRSATITVSGPGVSNKTVTVTQDALVPMLSITPANKNVSVISGSVTFQVSSSIDWTASSDQPWCTVTPSGSGNGAITATFEENTNISARKAIITVSGPGVTNQLITVSQVAFVPMLTVTPANQNVISKSGTTNFTVVSNIDWIASSNQSWCTVTLSGSQTGILKAVYTANPDTFARTATITVSGSGVSNRVVNVIQSGAAPVIHISPVYQPATEEAGSADFGVTSNIFWSISSNQTWCTATSSGFKDGTLTATFTANPDTFQRSAIISVSGTGVTEQIIVAQSGADPFINISPANQIVSETSGSTNFAVSSNIHWNASSNQAWCTVTSGFKDGTLTATFTANPDTFQREATIIVSGAGVSSQNVIVTQAGGEPTLSVSPVTRNVSAASGSTNFAVSSNIHWSASSNQTWCTVTSSGLKDGVILATFTANPDTFARTATITVSGSGVSNRIVNVIQSVAAPVIHISPVYQSLTEAAGSTDFAVTSNIFWSTSSNQTWCTVTSSGFKDGTLTATFTANPDTFQRSAIIFVSGTGVTEQIIVAQSGADPFINISPANHIVTEASGSTNFAVSSNIHWTASSNQTWCTVTSGFKDGTLTATFTANPDTFQRAATITVSGAGVGNQLVTITQSESDPMLSVSPVTRNVSAPFGTTNFAVASNIHWTVSSNQTWCTVTPSGNGDGIITATYTTNSDNLQRTATITFSGTGVSDQIVTVVQDAKRPLTIDISAENKIYDGNTDATVSAFIISGLVEGDIVTVTATNSRFDTKNTGTGKTVTADISIGGTDAENYIINSVATTTANITKADITAVIVASPDYNSYQGGTTITFTAIYPAAVDEAEGIVTISFMGDGIDESYTMTSTDRKSWTYEWVAPVSVEATIAVNAALQDTGENFNQTTTGKTSVVLDNTPSGISITGLNKSGVLLYPTINQGSFKMNVTIPEIGVMKIKVINMQGRTVEEIKVDKVSGSANFEVIMNNACKGLYFIETTINDFRNLQTMIVE